MTYDVRSVTFWQVVETDAQGNTHVRATSLRSEEQARDMVRALENNRRIANERQRKAHAQKGKWTPERLRSALAASEWVVRDLAAEYPGDGFDGLYEFEHPLPRERGYSGDPNFVVRVDDRPSAGFEHPYRLTIRGDSRNREYEFVTVDRLATALVKRGLINPEELD